MAEMIELALSGCLELEDLRAFLGYSSRTVDRHS
jgi:hypothetical protein